MKKSKIILIVAIIIVIALVIGGIIFFTSSSNKKAITEEEFVSKLEEKGYSIGEIQNDLSNNENVKSSKMAISNDYNTLIQFYTLNDKSSANNFYGDVKAGIEETKQDGDTPIEEKEGNYENYTLKSNGNYVYVAKVEDTVIYINASESNEESIKEILKELNY